MAQTERIGTLTVEEPTEYTDRSFETAAWSRTMMLTPGTYDLTTDGYWAMATIPGTITEDYFASLWGGVPISKYDHTQNAGKPTQKHVQTYVYEVARAALQSGMLGGHKLTLDPAYEARAYTVESTYDGRMLDLTGLFRKADGTEVRRS